MSRKKAQVGLRARTVDHLNAWLIMLPSLVLMLFFVWEPLFESVVMSLYKTRNIELVNFIGFKNYISVMGKDDFLQALTNTFSYTFWSLLLGFFLPMVLALLIGETVRSKSFSVRWRICRICCPVWRSSSSGRRSSPARSPAC